MINFRYKIVRPLGSGGSGEVFLVKDLLQSDFHSAMKILHPPGQSGSLDDDQFRNEVGILMALRHPNLVRIYDVGTIQSATNPALTSRRFYTMDYLEGRDALQAVMELTSDASRAEFLESLLLQALGVLHYVHGQGVIHFDVKPENLMVIGSGVGAITLKLTDFGFGKQQDAGEKSQIPETRGTIAYTAPELLRGEPADSRVDLYSLGATFFHLLDGCPPFESSESVELIKAALTQEPVFRKATGPESDRLRAVITGLMHKDPRRRFTSARDAANALMEGKPENAGLHVLFAARPPFVGRSLELRTFEQALAELSHGVTPGASIAVIGEEGIGKSSLLERAAGIARRFDIQVFTATPESEIPFGGILPLIALLRADMQSRPDVGTGVMKKYGHIFDIVTGDKTGSRSPEWFRDPEKYTDQIARLIAECSAITPLVIIADDADRLDAQSLGVLRAVVLYGSKSRLLVLASESGGSANTLSGFRDSLLLQELDREAVEKMTEVVFGDGSRGRELGARFFELYGGSPAIITEVLNALLLSNPQKGTTDINAVIEGMHVPSTTKIDDFLSQRFHSLKPEWRVILSVLSCFEHGASIPILTSLIPMHPLRIRDTLGFLQVSGLVNLFDATDRSSIRTEKMRSLAYGVLGGQRSVLHDMIARAMEGITNPTLEDLRETARQFLASGEYAKAGEYSERAADEAARRSAFPLCVQLLEQAVYCLARVDAATISVPLMIKLMHASLQSGNYHQVLEIGRTLLHHPDSGGARQKMMGLAHMRLGEYEESRKELQGVLKLSDDPVEMAEVQQELIGIEITLGNYAEAERVCSEQLHQVKALGDDRLLAAVHTDLGIAMFYQNRFDESLEYLNASLEEYRRGGLVAKIPDAIMNLGNVFSARGDVKTAIAHWGDALDASKEYGTLNQQAQIENNLGIANFNLKEHATAKEHYARAREIFERIASRSGLSYTLTNFGEVYYAEGEYEQAINTWTMALSLYEEMDDVHGLTETQIQLSEIFLLLGAWDRVSTLLDQAGKRIVEKRLETFKAAHSLVEGRLLLGKKDPAGALKTFGRARDMYMAEGRNDKSALCDLRIAESYILLQRVTAAREALFSVLSQCDPVGYPVLNAEAKYLLGMTGHRPEDPKQGNPLTWFKEAMEAISAEPISELTWKVCYALGRELMTRGQQERARSYLKKAAVVLGYFESQFASQEMKDAYLSIDGRGAALSAIQSIITK